MQWLAELSQIPLTTSGATIASVSQKYVPNPIATRRTRDLTLSCRVWLDSLVIPAYVAVLSALALLVQSATDSVRTSVEPDDVAAPAVLTANLSCFRRTLSEVGGPTIFTFRILQLFAIFALLGISIAEFVLHTVSTEVLSDPRIVQIVQIALYVSPLLYVAAIYSRLLQAYLSVLGVLQLCSTRMNRRAHAYVSWTLFLVWSAYLYRNVWPLATVDRVPADTAEGPFLWAKLALLSVAGVILPVVAPRKYTPVNPKVSSAVCGAVKRELTHAQEILDPNPEQTASLISLASYTFISPIVWLAYRMPHLPFDMFPPLPDYDHLRNIVGRSFPVSRSSVMKVLTYSLLHQILDPILNRSRRHLAFKLIKVFRMYTVPTPAQSLF